ncbi:MULTISPECIES: pyocin activator PrtN family protein [Pseudomonas]|uniref:pyocin activator PrtN family protein n=1 Tax=Pseudomonadaceae TaxID=135621 RepID=UPI0003FA9CAA|nr:MULTISPECIES: pyocin activator PrtN family protein [Pseudomonas]
MSDTLSQLMQQWKASSLTLTQVREHYFPHIKTDKHLRKLIRQQKVDLAAYQHSESRLACWWVRLKDLADFLDKQSEKAA